MLIVRFLDLNLIHWLICNKPKLNFYDFFLESVSEMLLVHGFGFSVIGFWLIMLFFLRNTQDEKVTKPTTKKLKPKTIAQLTLIFQKAKVKQVFSGACSYNTT